MGETLWYHGEMNEENNEEKLKESKVQADAS